VKKQAEQEDAIFRQVLQISNRIPTNSCKFSTESIMDD